MYKYIALNVRNIWCVQYILQLWGEYYQAERSYKFSNGTRIWKIWQTQKRIEKNQILTGMLLSQIENSIKIK